MSRRTNTPSYLGPLTPVPSVQQLLKCRERQGRRQALMHTSGDVYVPATKKLPEIYATPLQQWPEESAPLMWTLHIIIKPLLASRHIALDKNPGVRPRGIGDTARRIIAKAILTIISTDI